MNFKLGQNIIDKLRGKKKKSSNLIKIFGQNNQINRALSGLAIEIYGNNNTIFIDESVSYFHGIIYIGVPDCQTNNCKIVIGKNCVCNGCNIRLLEDDSRVSIGDDCLFSNNVSLWCTDTHTIVDCNDEILNLGKFISIGNHVWISNNVSILKNTKIPNNSIVGLGSVVTKEFEEENSIIAGNPARIVKRNINWSQERPQNYLRGKSNANN